MRCPICNCKMKHKSVCPYCKITGEQVTGASNQLAKLALRSGNKEKVVYSTTMPYDVNYTRLLLLTIFTGFLGVHNYYVGRDKKGLFCSIASALCLVFFIIDFAFGTTKYFIFDLFYEISFAVMTVVVLMWMYDILKLSFRQFKMPVIIPEEDTAKVNNEIKKNLKKKENQ